MSLNHLTSQASPQPYLNPRVQSLVVDGKISTPSAPSLSLSRGLAGFFSNPAPYVVSVSSSPITVVSGLANYQAPLGNLGTAQTASGIMVTSATSPYFDVDANISFSGSVAGTYTFYIGVNGTFGYPSFRADLTSDPTAVVQVSLIGRVGLNASDTVVLGAIGPAGAISVHNWTIRIRQLENF